MTKRLAAIIFGILVLAACFAVPVLAESSGTSAANDNKGDVWVSNSPTTDNGHEHVPHLDCGTIYLHGASLDDSGTYTIDSIPGTGSGTTVMTGTWATPSSGDVIAFFDAAALVSAAVGIDHAVANPNQGFHFKLTLSQEGVKHKVFWVRCDEERPTPGITIAKTADSASVTAGSPIGFTVTVSAAADAFADDATLSDPLPQGTGLNWSISPAYAGPGTCIITGTGPAPQTLTCSAGDLDTSGDDPVSFTVHVTSPTTVATADPAALTVTNTATAQADDVDPVHATAHATVNPAAPHLTVTKTADDAAVTAGTAIGFTVTVGNTGPGTAHNATLSDPLPSAGGTNWSVSPAYGGPGTCSVTGTNPSQTLACSFGDMASGATASVHVSSPTTAAAAATLDNTATAQADNNDPVHASARIVLIAVLANTPAAPHLSISKTGDEAAVTAGTLIGYTVTVTNTGPGVAHAVTLNDPLPSVTGTSWAISPSYAGPGTCSVTGTNPSQTLACSFGDMASGATASVHVSSPTLAGVGATLVNTAVAEAANDPGVSASAQIVVGVAPVATAVLGEKITRGTLPRTGGVPLGLMFPALALIGMGAELIYLARRRLAATC